jgi:hypothetical protein
MRYAVIPMAQSTDLSCAGIWPVVPDDSVVENGHRMRPLVLRATSSRASASCGAIASTPSSSPTTISLGLTTMPPTVTGTLISPGPLLYGPRCVTPRAYTRKSRVDRTDVADHAELLGVRHHDVAHQRLAQFTPAVHHQHIAGTHEVERAVNGEVSDMTFLAPANGPLPVRTSLRRWSGGVMIERAQEIDQEGQERIPRLATRNGRALWPGR